MITISLAMIVKNEEKTLSRCLDCVKNIADEIIIVDTGSTDSTKKIAQQYTPKVYDFIWCDDFSAARNYSFSHAKCDYIFWLDADDVISIENQQKLILLKQTLARDTDIVMMKYDVGFDENQNVTMSFYRERLVKNNKQHFWQDPVHEVITPSGKIIYSDISITHRQPKKHGSAHQRNLNIYRGLIDKNIKLNPRQQFYYSRELMQNNLTLEATKGFTNFLNHSEGWIENRIEACKNLSECYKILNRKKESLQALLRSLEFDCPRAEICCELGNYFLDENKIWQAIFWYKTAINCEKNIKKGGFFLSEYYNFIPNIQLCVCYDKLGDKKTANEYNEIAAKYKPNSASIKHNRQYFKSLKQ